MNSKDPLTNLIIKGAIEVHRQLGPGLLESAYEACLAFELKKSGLHVESQVPLPVVYKGNTLDCGYRMDIVVNKKCVIEIKNVEKIIPIHEAQLLTYLKLSKIKTGLILNFNVESMKNGIKRMVH